MTNTTWDGRSGYGGKRSHRLRNLILVLLILAVACFAGLQAYIGVHSRDNLRGDAQIMVVFGCKVESWGPSILLQDRIDTAAEYLKEHPEVTAVLSGGQGSNEHVSEAQAMFDSLTSQGIDSDRLLLEDQSHNTWENVNYTMELLAEEGFDPTANVILVSNGFHLARIEMLWARAGAGTDPISTLAAPTSHFPSAVGMFFREPLALVKSFVFDR